MKQKREGLTDYQLLMVTLTIISIVVAALK